jgi:hypothetical protein
MVPKLVPLLPKNFADVNYDCFFSAKEFLCKKLLNAGQKIRATYIFISFFFPISELTSILPSILSFLVYSYHILVPRSLNIHNVERLRNLFSLVNTDVSNTPTLS